MLSIFYPLFRPCYKNKLTSQIKEHHVGFTPVKRAFYTLARLVASLWNCITSSRYC